MEPKQPGYAPASKIDAPARKMYGTYHARAPAPQYFFFTNDKKSLLLIGLPNMFPIVRQSWSAVAIEIRYRYTV